MFFWSSLAFSMIQWLLTIWSLIPLPFLKRAWTSGSSRFTYCWRPGLENFVHYFTSMWDECNCAVVWAFLGISFLWDWNENWPFPVLWPLLSFPNLLTDWVQHFHSIIFKVSVRCVRYQKVMTQLLRITAILRKKYNKMLIFFYSFFLVARGLIFNLALGIWVPYLKLFFSLSLTVFEVHFLFFSEERTTWLPTLVPIRWGVEMNIDAGTHH